MTRVNYHSLPDAPVLLLAFNRPEQTRQVLDRIAEYTPSRIYVACDGPRPGNLDDRNLVLQVQEVVRSTVDWPCALHTRFREVNLGCAKGVVDAISWFFSNEEQGIILEDDCLPHPTFFQFCEELLNCFKRDTRIWSISGDNFHGRHLDSPASFFFSRYFHCWGWAAWRRSWSFFPSDTHEMYRSFASGKIPISGMGKISWEYWKIIAKMCAEKMIDSWAYAYCIQSLIRGGIHIHPRVNLVSNIGFLANATHTRKGNSIAAKALTQLPLIYPSGFEIDSNSDYLTEKRHFRITLYTILKLHIRLQRYRIQKSKSI